MRVKNVIDFLDRLFPPVNASDFDKGKIGLQIGDENEPLKGVLLALDLNKAVIKEAINKDVNLIITHHPFIFYPLSNILFNSSLGEILELMFKHRISLFVMHTNLDVGYNGVNDTLAQKLGFLNFEPKEENAIKDNFLRYGNIEKRTLGQYAREVKERLALTGLRVAGDLDKIIEKVAVIGGSGGQFEEIDRALALGCDLFITGEVSLHIAQYAIIKQISIIEVAHGVERIVFTNLLKTIENEFPGLQVINTNINTDPFMVI